MRFTDATSALTIIAGGVVLARGRRSWAYPYVVSALAAVCLAAAVVLVVAVIP